MTTLTKLKFQYRLYLILGILDYISSFLVAPTGKGHPYLGILFGTVCIWIAFSAKDKIEALEAENEAAKGKLPPSDKNAL